eukprot:5817222-Alexandrium_andersonii.AAC.1
MDARHGLIDGVLVHASFAQDRMGQDRPRAPVLDDEDCQRCVTTALRQEAVVHGNIGDRVVARESACVWDI